MSDSPFAIAGKDFISRVSEILEHDKFSDDRFYKDLTSIVESWNTQVRNYNKLAWKSVLHDVYTSTMESIDWSRLFSRFTEEFKTSTTGTTPSGSQLEHITTLLSSGKSIPNIKIPKISIDEYDNDDIILMHMNIDNPKKFNMYKENAMSSLQSIISEIYELESECVKFRTAMNKNIMNNVIPKLYNIHLGIAKSKKELGSIPSLVLIGNKEVESTISQRKFIESSLKIYLTI